MTLRIDHVAVPARDAAASARWLAGILGAAEPRPEGPDGDMWAVPVGEAAVLFATTETVTGHHLAFAVGQPEFGDVVGRLRAHGLAFGNDPEDPRNGRTDDPLGSPGRVYFTDRDGHLFEVTVTV